MELLAQIKGEAVYRIAGPKGFKAINKGAIAGLWKCLGTVERHHKRKEMIRKSGGRLMGKNAQPPHPVKLTIRTGSLSKSYTGRVVERTLKGYYGSDLTYAPVHEFGSPRQNIPARPGLQRTLKATTKIIDKIMLDALDKGLDSA